MCYKNQTTGLAAEKTSNQPTAEEIHPLCVSPEGGRCKPNNRPSGEENKQTRPDHRLLPPAVILSEAEGSIRYSGSMPTDSFANCALITDH